MKWIPIIIIFSICSLFVESEAQMIIQQGDSIPKVGIPFFQNQVNSIVKSNDYLSMLYICEGLGSSSFKLNIDSTGKYALYILRMNDSSIKLVKTGVLKETDLQNLKLTSFGNIVIYPGNDPCEDCPFAFIKTKSGMFSVISFISGLTSCLEGNKAMEGNRHILEFFYKLKDS